MHSFWILIVNSHRLLTVLQKKLIINSIIKTKNNIKTMRKHSTIGRPTKLTKTKHNQSNIMSVVFQKRCAFSKDVQ